jgi:hypothetical protein
MPVAEPISLKVRSLECPVPKKKRWLIMAEQRSTAKIIPFRRRATVPASRVPFQIAFDCESGAALEAARKSEVNTETRRGAVAGLVFIAILALVTGFLIRELMEIPNGQAETGLDNTHCPLRNTCGQ